MSITESNNSSQKPPGSNLSVEQLNAIDILVQGKTDQETAQSVGVVRETVTRWRNDNLYFAAELNKQRKLIWGQVIIGYGLWRARRWIPWKRR